MKVQFTHPHPYIPSPVCCVTPWVMISSTIAQFVCPWGHLGSLLRWAQINTLSGSACKSGLCSVYLMVEAGKEMFLLEQLYCGRGDV